VPWDPFVPFSAQALWRQQLPPEVFDERLARGMKRLWVNIVSWLAHQLPGAPLQQRQEAQRTGRAVTAFAGTAMRGADRAVEQQTRHEKGIPPLEYLNH
jgi:hypothetical protein